MDFTRIGGGRRQRKCKVESSYISSLQFYTEPPSGDISLTDFDEYALERLKILRSVERINLSGQVRSPEEWMNKLYDDFMKNKYFIVAAEKYPESEGTLEARRKDCISHFILRLAYCRTEDLRRWFVSNETDLFIARFMRASINGVDLSHFLSVNNLYFEQIPDEDMKREADNLMSVMSNVSTIDQLENKVFYKVPFTQALELVRSRKIFIKDGFAYVPSSDLVSLVAAVFRTKLSRALVITNKALPQVDDDERLTDLLRDFDKRHTGANYSQKKVAEGEQISPELIDQLSTTAFPLCMRQMQEHLRIHNHMKHGGRMQYGLFLKAAGMSLEDALKFWRSHFTKVMDIDKFERQYAYTIRHNYGKEGKRTDYTPYSCIKIITSNVGPGDCHGCPFKHSDKSILHQKLITYKVSQQAISEIMDLTSQSHYQIACQRYFEATHKAILECGINHPNQYFEESMALLHDVKTPNKGTNNSQVKTQRSIMTSESSSKVSVPQGDLSGIESLLFDDDDSIFEQMES